MVSSIKWKKGNRKNRGRKYPKQDIDQSQTGGGGLKTPGKGTYRGKSGD
jgi:hypothetical protein